MSNYQSIPNSVFEDERLSTACIAVYMVLNSYSQYSDGIFPSYETIAKRAHLSKRTVIRVVKKLCFYGYVVKRKGTFKGTEKQASNFYILNPIPQIIKIEKNVDNLQTYPHTQCQNVTPDQCQNVTPNIKRYEYIKNAREVENNLTASVAHNFPAGVGGRGNNPSLCVDNEILGQSGTKKLESTFDAVIAPAFCENYMQ